MPSQTAGPERKRHDHRVPKEIKNNENRVALTPPGPKPCAL